MKIRSLAAVTALMVSSSAAMAMPTFNQIVSGGAAISADPAQYFKLTDTDGNSDDMFSYIELKNASDTHNLGIYSFITDSDGTVTVTDRLEIFGSASEGEMASVNFDLGANVAWIEEDGKAGLTAGDSRSAAIGQYFGFYLDNNVTSKTLYSHYSLNPDSVDHLGVYLTGGTGGEGTHFDIALAWEDRNNNSDMDYNDLVAYVNDVAPVPEPGTLALLGLGLLGLGAARRRQA